MLITLPVHFLYQFAPEASRMRRATGIQEVVSLILCPTTYIFRRGHEIISTTILSLPLIQVGQ